MPNERSKGEPESKFAEVIRKGKEKRADMNKPSHEREEPEQAVKDVRDLTED